MFILQVTFQMLFYVVFLAAALVFASVAFLLLLLGLSLQALFSFSMKIKGRALGVIGVEAEGVG